MSQLRSLFLVALLALACGDSGDGSAAGEGAARGWSALSASGLHRVSIQPEDPSAPPRLGPMHTWVVDVKTREGEPVALTGLRFDGGMPQHGHGFQTSPRVTHTRPDGAVLVDGVRFHMSGAWTLRVDFVAAGTADAAVFEIQVDP